MDGLRKSSPVQDIHSNEAEVTIKALTAWATGLLAIGALCVKLYRCALVVRTFMKDIGALPQRVKETHETVLAHGRVLELHLSSASVASFHCNQLGVVVRSSMEYVRLSTRAAGNFESRSFRDLFVRDEREELDKRWETAVRERVEFSFVGHVQAAEMIQPTRVILRIVPLRAAPEGKTSESEWFGIMRAES